MDTLKQLQEKWLENSKEYYEIFSLDNVRLDGIFDLEELTTLAYNAGKADMLDTVLKEIGGLEFDSGFETSFNKQYRQGKEEARNEILDILKNKLLDNKTLQAKE